VSDKTEDLRGALFKNPSKRPDKKDPDYTGSCIVGGNAYYMDAWINESRDGTRYMGLKFKLKGPPQAKPAAPADDLPFDDEIPF
jgi:hypothetical protein